MRSLRQLGLPCRIAPVIACGDREEECRSAAPIDGHQKRYHDTVGAVRFVGLGTDINHQQVPGMSTCL
jgi:hypothetical protein